MTNIQRRIFILITLPVCCLILASGISDAGRRPDQLDVRLKVGNMWSTLSSHGEFATQENFNVKELKF